MSTQSAEAAKVRAIDALLAARGALPSTADLAEENKRVVAQHNRIRKELVALQAANRFNGIPSENKRAMFAMLSPDERKLVAMEVARELVNDWDFVVILQCALATMLDEVLTPPNE